MRQIYASDETRSSGCSAVRSRRLPSTDLPDGLIFRNHVNPSRIKYFAFPEMRVYGAPVPSHKRGVSRSSRTLMRDAMDAAAREDEARISRTAKACGPDPPMLGSSLRAMISRATVTKKARTPGRARHKPHNHCAGDAGVCSVVPVVCSCAISSAFRAHEARGYNGTRHSLRPLFS